MPELPEVETVMRGLAPVLMGQRIKSVRVRQRQLRVPLPATFARTLAKARVTGLKRRAKYILVSLDNGKTLLIHLGMSGRLLIHTKPAPAQKHDHVVFTLNNHAQIVFNDPRRFGLMALAPSGDLANHKTLRHLGVEPLEKEFSAAYLRDQLRTSSRPVKLAIMDQELVVGVGNIYACEALFAAHINPNRKARTLGDAECRTLTQAIKTVLKRAIKKGGSSLRDYVQASGEAGYFQHEFKVYGHSGHPCPRCKGRHTISRITQGGRSTFFCASCQK